MADQHAAKIVSVDVTDLNPKLHSTPGIVKITGDSNGELALKQAIIAVGNEPIDLLYIDAEHRFSSAITNFGLYVALLRPRFVVMDDIVLNEGMRSLWDIVRATHGSDVINCVDIVPEIRAKACGFGLVKLR